MKGIFNKILNALKGNKLYFSIGAGAVAATMWAKTNKAFYYGLLAVLLIFKLAGSKILGTKWTNIAVVGLVLVFVWAFVSEVILKKNTTNRVTTFFTNVWTKITSFLPKSN